MSLKSEILEQPEVLSHLFQTQEDHVNEMAKIILSRTIVYDTSSKGTAQDHAYLVRNHWKGD